MIGKLLKRRRREADEALDRMTIAVNKGYVMATNPEAAAAWNAKHEPPQSVAEYRATMARLAARHPDAVKQVH